MLLRASVAVLMTLAPAVCSAGGPKDRPAPPEDNSPPAAKAGLSAPKAETTHVDPAHLAKAQRLINGGIGFLLSRPEADGGWSLGGGAQKPAATAMALKILLQHPDFDANSPEVKKGFQVLLGYRRKDGGFYEPTGGFENYTTSLAVMALVAARDPKFNGVIREAVGYLKGRQIVPGSESPDGEVIGQDHPFRGGVSYGDGGRPDGSNAGMWAEAMHEAGEPADSEAMQNVLAFFSRLQNRSESNPLPWAADGPNDGGFVYAPAAPGDKTKGESKAGPGPGGRGLRSYGSLTYMGFKTLLYAGLTRDDPRVRAAYGWIRKYWRLDSNPNMPQTQSFQGLYYYYHAFAKALRAWGEPVITDVGGRKHNWRHELIDALAKRVSRDGSWTNHADRWHEGSPVLVTCYSVLALQEALKK